MLFIFWEGERIAFQTLEILKIVLKTYLIFQVFEILNMFSKSTSFS